MKVLTLSPTAFDEACGRLEQAVCDDGWRPGFVVGIESGGRYVAERILPDVPHGYIALRRPSTDGKKGFVAWALSRLPRRVCDALRVMEARLLEMKRPSPRRFKGELPDGLKLSRNILIIDDAVDSGATMQAVYDAVREACPYAGVRTAAITVTTRHPLIVPDKSLFNQLIRFPWSIDARN